MYKLTVVDGPNRGSSYMIQEGDNWIGRQIGNAVVLTSAKVSKRHCLLVVNEGELTIQDQGSANGTFVNGVLTRIRKIQPGDRISIGEFVLEVSKAPTGKLKPAPAVAGLGNVVPFRVQQPQTHGALALANQTQANPLGSEMPQNTGDQAPNDLLGKVTWYFEKLVMPIFYGMHLKYEWKNICMALVAAFVVGNLLVSVYPLINANRVAVMKESARRARFIAKQIADKNAAFLAANAETKTEIGIAEHAEGVRLAVLVDLDNRIIAPSTKLNQYLQYGKEAVFAVGARNMFRSGREMGLVSQLDSETMAAIEPVKVLSSAAGRNEIVAMAVVSIDTSLSVPSFGEMGMIYSEVLIITGVLAALIFYILYRLTLKPFQVLNEDMDKVLKGDMPQVTREFKFEEMDSLWDLINSALQRVSRGADNPIGLGEIGATQEDFLAPIKALAASHKGGLVACDTDRRVLYMNSLFEDIAGIRADSSIGQELASVARDQALTALINDLFERAVVGGDPVVEDFDFSGISYKMQGMAFGPPGGTAKCFVLIAIRNEGA